MLSRQEGSTTRHLASAQHWTGLAGGDTGRLFLTFGGPVCADRISYCPLDRVLTYKNLIYLLNLQFTVLLYCTFPDNYAFLSLLPSQIKNTQSADTVPVHGHSPLVSNLVCMLTVAKRNPYFKVTLNCQ